jgi:hypothetical protein
MANAFRAGFHLMAHLVLSWPVGPRERLTLHFAGLPQAVETDIDGTHNFFQRRGPVREFFAHHQLEPSEKIAIEKQSEYEYDVLPAR